MIFRYGLTDMSKPPHVCYTDNLAKLPSSFTPHPASRILIVPRYPAPPRSGKISFFAEAGRVGEPRWFYRNPEEWTAMAERLKLTPVSALQGRRRSHSARLSVRF